MQKNVNLLIVFSILIVILLFIVGIRYKQMTEGWSLYVSQLKSVVAKYPALNSQEDAQIIGTTIITLPSVANPLYKQPQALQTYIAAISKQTNRDIVILDTSKTILADTIPANVGQEYADDKKHEVQLTLTTGLMHVFVEKSKDYPQGISQTVVPMKGPNGDVVGLIIISDSTIFQR